MSVCNIASGAMGTLSLAEEGVGKSGSPEAGMGRRTDGVVSNAVGVQKHTQG